MGYMVSRDDGWRMPDWLWEQIEPLLPAPPPHPLGCHRPRVPNRSAMNAILLILRTGMHWNALDVTGIAPRVRRIAAFRSGNGPASLPRCRRRGLLAYDAAAGIDWSFLSADGAMTKAPLGGEQTGANPTDRGKKGRSVRFSARQAGYRSGWHATAPTATTTSC